MECTGKTSLDFSTWWNGTNRLKAARTCRGSVRLFSRVAALCRHLP